MEPAGKHEPACKHIGRFDPGQDGFTRVFRNCELNRSLSLALDHRNPLTYPIIFDQICNDEFAQIAAAQLDVDGDVEQRQIASIARYFKPRLDDAALSWPQRPFLTDGLALFSGSAFWSGCWKLDYWYDLPSDPPSQLNHQHRAGCGITSSLEKAVFRSRQTASVLHVY